MGLKMDLIHHIVNPFLVAPEKIPVELSIRLLKSTALQDIVDCVVESTPETYVLPRRILALCAYILSQIV
jgi:hypothetical protein